VLDLQNLFGVSDGTQLKSRVFSMVAKKQAKHPVSGKRMRNKSTGRNYAKEYAKYQGKKEQINKRSSRNTARAKLVKEGVVSKGDGKDVDHKNNNAKQNIRSNLRAKSKFKNRSFKRNAKGGHAGKGK
jgi:hypothetical protein